MTDIYRSYIILTKKLFPNAKVVLDKFHLVQSIGKAFQKIRIRLMNQLKNQYNRTYYQKLKILQKNRSKLNYEYKYWRADFKNYLSEKEVLERLLTYSTELEEAYLVYQNILHAFQTKDYPIFLELINQATTIKEFIAVFKTFKHYQSEI